ncbi:MAG: EVE domain-containing protein [Planctomycetes bacterium]|nr:EVE domain-containing protein [Planctomycetota bacterium]
MGREARNYWLVKSEPSVFSFDALWKAKGRRAAWEGVRNYQARNFMRDGMRVGDGVIFYHSSTEPAGVAGFAEVASAPYADPTQFDPASEYHDPASDRAEPRWVLVDVRATERAPRFVALDRLRAAPELAAMALLKRGNRLSVQPVTPAEWLAVRRLAGL